MKTKDQEWHQTLSQSHTFLHLDELVFDLRAFYLLNDLELNQLGYKSGSLVQSFGQ
jgi:hypothetical protein